MATPGEHDRPEPRHPDRRAQGCWLREDPVEKVSGTSTKGRQELHTLLEFIDAGDVLMVTRIDRLARSIGDLQDIVRALGPRASRYGLLSSRSIPAPPPAKPSWTCSACSQSSRPTCARSGRWKASQRPRLLASTRAVRRLLTRPIVDLRAQGFGPSQIARKLSLARVRLSGIAAQ